MFVKIGLQSQVFQPEGSIHYNEEPNFVTRELRVARLTGSGRPRWPLLAVTSTGTRQQARLTLQVTQKSEIASHN